MSDDIIKKLYDKYFKNWLKKYYKYILTILLYLMYQSNFLIALFEVLGINILKLAHNYKMIILYINDIIYILTLVYLFKEDIKNGIKSLKNNFYNILRLSLSCWAIGIIVMGISTFIINLILTKDVSNNEELVRQSIKLAPFYMLFSCSIVAPIFEEMVFRKSLNGLIKRNWLFIVVSGLGFGLLHVLGSFTNPLEFLYIIPYGSMGCSFAYLLTKTNNITLPILIHMAHNFILVTIQIIGGLK